MAPDPAGSATKGLASVGPINDSQKFSQVVAGQTDCGASIQSVIVLESYEHVLILFLT
jgi:hypothetical protein